jgi:3-oxoacyl-[acyl-carrier-protein] synthase II
MAKLFADHEDRSLVFAKYAVDQALETAQIDGGLLSKKRVSVCLGTIAAGLPTFENTFRKMRNGSQVQKEDLNFSTANLTDFICSEYGVTGYRFTLVTACSSGNNAIGTGYDLVKSGLTDIAITGGVDLLTELGHAGFNILRTLTHDKCRPFDLNRSGFEIGEGAGILILESLQSCRERRVEPFAEVSGYGSSCDAYHATAPDPTGAGAAHSIAMALHNSGLKPTDIDYINAHGTATPQNDAMETKAIKSVFGKHAYKIPVTSIKPLIGHTMGAAGAIEAIASIIMMREGYIVPTHNYETPDPECDLNYLPNELARADTETILSTSFGFGGSNCCIILHRWS